MTKNIRGYLKMAQKGCERGSSRDASPKWPAFYLKWAILGFLAITGSEMVVEIPKWPIITFDQPKWAILGFLS